MMQSNVAYLLKARNVEPEETSIAREQHDNNTQLSVFYEVHATFPWQQVCMQNIGTVESSVSHVVHSEATKGVNCAL
jgi:hypothetical protein